MEQLPNPHSTPITPKSVTGLDPKTQEILLRHANVILKDDTLLITPQVLADAQAHAKQIESTLTPEHDD